MKFGYGLLTAQRPPESGTTYSEVYERSIDLARRAEEAGFDSVWVSEHHFFDDGYAPSVFPFVAAIARETSTIDVGTSVALAPLYHPVRLAEDAATVDLLSDGRFTLGIANGYMDREFEVFDTPKEKRATYVEEAIEICRRAWTEESFTFRGDVHEFEDLRVEPKPEREGGPRILLGGTSKPAVGRAGRRADGHVGIIYYDEAMSYSSSFAQFRDNAEWLASRRDLDGEDFVLSVMQYTHLAEDDEAAWDELRPALVYSRRKYAEHAAGRDASDWDLETMSDERLSQLRAGALVGSPDTVVETLREYERQLDGELHFIARLWHPTMSHETLVRSLELFADEVIPEFS
jgi:alkanesulfonate monooxygenase SsuD/methylene tetrahydromethanopterin reductase-like flavin-dependent oxidoreductase (luciferase family)